MPFTCFAKIENFLPESLKDALSDDDVFLSLEAAASEVIKSITGLAVPADLDDSPSWVHYPAALLIKRAASAFISTKSKELLAEIESDYQLALSLLQKHALSSPLAMAKVGRIAEVDDAL